MRFGSASRNGKEKKITLPELLAIAERLSILTGVMLGRDEKRRKVVLVKWFADNWEQFKPFIGQVERDMNGNVDWDYVAEVMNN